MPLEFPGPNIILGAGRFFIDRYEENGARGRETYIGDTVGAALSATVQRTTIFSGDGAVATKLVDKVTQVDRTLGITPQDATLDNMALFLIASKPTAFAGADAASVAFTLNIPLDATVRDYFQLETTAGTAASEIGPAGRPMYKAAAGNAFTFKTDEMTAGTLKAPESGKFLAAPGDLEIDLGTGRARISEGGESRFKTAISGRTAALEVGVTGSKIQKVAFHRVRADDQTKQVRVAVRYIEEPDEGVQGRNIYIPQASVAPAGEAALKSRDTPMQFPLTLGIEQSNDGFAQVYIDGADV